MLFTKLASDLLVLHGAVNSGVLVKGDRALLIDCCDSVTPSVLSKLGVQHVDWILCTQHRRPNTAGIYQFAEGGTRIAVPAGEAALFEGAEAHWADWRNRWHVYHFQPGPQAPAKSVRIHRGVAEGDTVEWEGRTIRVIDTPGATDGSVSYLVDASDWTFCFSGDAIYGPGKVWDLFSLQKGGSDIGDYHGFLGNRVKLIPSLRKLANCGADVLVPSHGEPITDPQGATALLEERLNGLWRNYTSISALNHYFPALFDDTRDDPDRMEPVPRLELPEWIRRVAYTSFAVVSDTGAALLIDCGHDTVLATLGQWRGERQITSVEGCWVTHYHDDHVDSLHRVAHELRCPIMTEEHLAEIVEYPQRFMLPCISPCPAPVGKVFKHGESWNWREFRLTALHLPGQTLYHSGLIVEGRGAKAMFAGDSAATTGLDDYTSGNRVFLGEGRGSRRCLDLWREHRPDYIVNCHQDNGFRFGERELGHMERVLALREELIAEMTPWENANLAIDEWWVRAYPYEQETTPGSTVCVQVHFTNHGPEVSEAHVRLVMPDGWRWDKRRSRLRVRVPPRTDGTTGRFEKNPDGVASVYLKAPPDAAPGRYVIPVRVAWRGRYLGQIRHAIVEVRGGA